MSEIRERILEQYSDEQIKFADGFDAAILGIHDNFTPKPRVVYSKNECLIILMRRDGMDYEMALEFFDFNISGAYVGEDTPIWCDDTF